MGVVRAEYHRRKILLSGIGNKCMLASIKISACFQKRRGGRY
jgi:hypothetical protein